jgi:hypothetical protein
VIAEKQMRKFKKIEQFKKSRFFLAILCLIIGATSTIIYYEGKDLYDWIRVGLSYTNRIEIVKAEASEVEPQEGEVVSQDTGSLVKVPVEPTRGDIEGLIALYFGDEADNAIKIVECESSMNPLAVNNKNTNGSIDCGLFQINSIHGYDCEELKDVEFNVKIAKKLYDKSGWQPWVCRNVIN